MLLFAATAVSALVISVKGFAACAVVLPAPGLGEVGLAQGPAATEALRAEMDALRAEVRNSTGELRKLILSRHAAVVEELHSFAGQVSITKTELAEALAHDRAEEAQVLREAVASEAVAADVARRQALVEAFREERDQEHAELVEMRHSLLNFTRAQSSQIKDILVEQLETLQAIKLRGAAGGKEKQAGAGLTRGIWSLLTSGDKAADSHMARNNSSGGG